MFKGSHLLGESSATAADVKKTQIEQLRDDRLIAGAAAVVGTAQLFAGGMNSFGIGAHNLGNGLTVLEDTHKPGNIQEGHDSKRRRNLYGAGITLAMGGLIYKGVDSLTTESLPQPNGAVEVAVTMPSLALSAILLAGVLKRHQGISRWAAIAPAWLAAGGAITQNLGPDGVKMAASAAVASGVIGLYNFRKHLRLPVPSIPDVHHVRWLGSTQ